MEVSKIKELTHTMGEYLNECWSSRSITVQQQRMNRPAKLPFPAWVIPIQLPVDEDHNITGSLYKTIESLSDGSEDVHDVGASAVNAEWIGFRQSTEEPPKSMTVSQTEQYDVMMKEAPNNVVLLYAHGGAFL